LKLLGRVLASLQRADVPHALIGAGAMAVHGVSRATLDLDLLVTYPALLVADRWEEIRGEGVTVDLRRGDAEDPLAGVIRLSREGERAVDVVVGRSAWQHGVIERAELFSVGDLLLPVVRAADLILLKLFAGGIQDSWDIEQLLAVGDRNALSAEVEGRLGELSADCADLWKKIGQR
jgi:hypothetical protein